MLMSLKDGAQPVGWAVRGLTGLMLVDQPQMAVYAVRTANPLEAERIVRSLFNIPDERPLDVFSNLSADTLDRLGLAPGEAAGPL